MSGDGEEAVSLSPDEELLELQKCYESMKPKLDGNPWCQFLLSSL
jgi:hypothetical protein